MDIYLAFATDGEPMARVRHWKISAAMAASYAGVAALLIYFIRDQNAVVAALVILFALVLLAGNLYVRAQGAGRRAQAPPDGGSGSPSRHPAHGSRPPDPEMGRR
jgi:hypothetical protein